MRVCVHVCVGMCMRVFVCTGVCARNGNFPMLAPFESLTHLSHFAGLSVVHLSHFASLFTPCSSLPRSLSTFRNISQHISRHPLRYRLCCTLLSSHEPRRAAAAQQAHRQLRAPRCTHVTHHTTCVTLLAPHITHITLLVPHITHVTLLVPHVTLDASHLLRHTAHARHTR